jgi:hypothetical protein
MGFNKRRMESERKAAAAKEAEARRALGPQILADAERVVATWNARQEAHMPMLFSPTIGAAISARYWYLWVRCPALFLLQAGAQLLSQAPTLGQSRSRWWSEPTTSYGPLRVKSAVRLEYGSCKMVGNATR